MGIKDVLRDLIRGGNPANGPYGHEIVWSDEVVSLVEGMTAEQLWKTQPYLRTVVNFISRNIAHLGIHVYKRVGENDRERDRNNPVALLLSRPNEDMTTYELINSLVASLKLHDVAYWFIAPDAESKSGWTLRPIPAGWVKRKGGTWWAAGEYEVTNPRKGTKTAVPKENMIVFHGWNPDNPAAGASPVEALRGLLVEQINAQAYRTQVWQRGGRVGAFLTRPMGAPVWDPEDKKRFRRDWNAKFTGNSGTEAGSTPMLADGMELKRIGFSAKEDEWAEVAKLSLAMVASVYHVNPTMVGLNENSTHSNVKEFRKMLYGDTLGPDIAMIEDRLNTFLVPLIAGADDMYVEFNIEEKLQGDFESQATQLQTATGGPWMTRNEARKLRNLPAIEGGDELIVPLNVIEGGQASPTDSAPKAMNVEEFTSMVLALQKSGVFGAVKETQDADDDEEPDPEPEPLDDDAEVDEVADTLATFFARQERALLSALGAEKTRRKAADWWDGERWDRELAADLFALAVSLATQFGRVAAVELGFDPDEYNEDATRAYLQAVADGRAALINAATLGRIEETLELEGYDARQAVKEVMTEAVEVRAPEAGRTIVTTLAGFAVVEAGKQLAPSTTTKTWRVRSNNPRSAHSRMNGETVGVSEKFSNGMLWPGDWDGGAENVSNCKCTITIENN